MPEAINGGPIALVKDGDKIIIDSHSREINWLVDEAEQAVRRKEWEASGKNQIRERRGILYKYARDVAVSGSAHSPQPCGINSLNSLPMLELTPTRRGIKELSVRFQCINNAVTLLVEDQLKAVNLLNPPAETS